MLGDGNGVDLQPEVLSKVPFLNILELCRFVVLDLLNIVIDNIKNIRFQAIQADFVNFLN